MAIRQKSDLVIDIDVPLILFGIDYFRCPVCSIGQQQLQLILQPVQPVYTELRRVVCPFDAGNVLVCFFTNIDAGGQRQEQNHCERGVGGRSLAGIGTIQYADVDEKRPRSGAGKGGGQGWAIGICTDADGYGHSR